MNTQKKVLALVTTFAIMTPLHVQSIHSTTQKTTEMELSMLTGQEKKKAIRDLYEKCLNKRDLSMLEHLISGDYNGLNGVNGPAGFIAPIAPLIESFPDIQWTIDYLIEEDDQVAVAWHWKGTHREDYLHISATGNSVLNEGMAIFQFKDGKIVRTKALTDRLGFLQETGQLPKDVNSIRGMKPDKQQVIFIDRFVVPQNSYSEFFDRAEKNRNYIKTLPGFVRDEAYRMNAGDGKIIFITVAVWANESALRKAKDAVQQEYLKQGFDIPAFLKRFDITMERGSFSPVGI